MEMPKKKSPSQGHSYPERDMFHLQINPYRFPHVSKQPTRKIKCWAKAETLEASLRVLSTLEKTGSGSSIVAFANAPTLLFDSSPFCHCNCETNICSQYLIHEIM